MSCFVLDDDRNTLFGCVHHSIFDGRSMELLLDQITSGMVVGDSVDTSSGPSHYSVRRYAAMERAMEEEGKTAQHITQWEKILDDTPPRLDLDTMAHQADTQSSSLYSTQSLHLDKKIVRQQSTKPTTDKQWRRWKFHVGGSTWWTR